MTALEDRTVPAYFAVTNLSGSAGVTGDTLAMHYGNLGYVNSGTSQIVHIGIDETNSNPNILEATSVGDAIAKTFTGDLVATLPVQRTATYDFSASNVGFDAADHKDFLVTGTGDHWQIWLEDLSGFADETSDWDYNDHYWDIAVTPYEPINISVAPSGLASEAGTTAGSFTFTRSGTDLSPSTTANYTVSGTARRSRSRFPPWSITSSKARNRSSRRFRVRPPTSTSWGRKGPQRFRCPTIHPS